MPGPDTVERWMKTLSVQEQLVKPFDVCPNGCYLYQDDNNIYACPNSVCSKPRYSNFQVLNQLQQAGVDLNGEVGAILKPVQQVSVVSVGASLAQMLLDDFKRDLFNYRYEFDQNIRQDGYFQDIFDGKVYRDLLVQQRGLFQNTNDIALMLVVDGFALKHKSKATLTIVTCYILNIDPSHR